MNENIMLSTRGSWDQDRACGIPLTVNCITTLLSPITALCVAGIRETDNAPEKKCQ
jgi:hypothetical protein